MPAGVLQFVLLGWLPLGWNRWLLVWLALAAATAGLVVLLRTRLRKLSAWRKCAILSLWVHVLLAVLATTVHLVSGIAGEGPDEPIRVAMLPAEAPAEVVPEKAEELPKWERPQDPPRLEPPPLMLPEATDSAPAEQDPAPEEAYSDAAPPEAAQQAAPPSEPLAAPPLLPAPQIDSQSEPVDESTASAEIESAADAAAADAAELSREQAEPQVDSAPSHAPTPTTTGRDAQPERPPAPPLYAARFSPQRDEIVARRGGNAQTEQAVRSALAWLAAAQSPDGRWSAGRFGAGSERRVLLGHERTGAGSRADSAVTGLALLAFMGSGHTHQQGAYSDHVVRGLEWLAAVQAADGSLAGEATTFDRTYCHSMATLAVCEAYAVTGDRRLQRIAAAAAAHSVNTQNPADGSWRYWPHMPGDLSQLGWQLMALKSAELAGLDVPPVVWTRADRFMRSVSRGSAGGLGCYRPDSRPTTSMTAEGLFCRQLLADRLGGAVDDGCFGEAAATLLREPPGGGETNLYYWYYGTLALCREQDRSPVAKAAWQRWNDGLIRSLLQQQRPDGSWPTSSVWGACGGQVYTTAIAALSLEAYYRYLPPATDAELARRNPWRNAR